MKKTALTTGMLAILSAAPLHAGGIDLSGQDVNILFEEGGVVQIALSRVDPSVSGTLNGVDSGDIAGKLYSPKFAYKQPVADKWSFAIIYDQPYGADVRYSPDYPLSIDPLDPDTPKRLEAKASTDALTALLRYEFRPNYSVYGGLTAQSINAQIGVPAALGYKVDAVGSTNFGYLVGFAWEKPEIAARISITYRSEVEHTMTQTETGVALAPGLPNFALVSETKITTPRSINLDFQTGIAEDTLLFGEVRWVDWGALVYEPTNYIANPLVDFGEAYINYLLGVGRQFTDQFSGAFFVGYEDSAGVPVSDLTPTDGYWSIGIAGTYEFEKVLISGGIQYIDVGDAISEEGAVFEDNHAWGIGLQFTYKL
ncbi:MAG: transporter [Mangrovicoccus sp.]|nr:transporter [Mangrovicoccus sp.]